MEWKSILRLYNVCGPPWCITQSIDRSINQSMKCLRDHSKIMSRSKGERVTHMQQRDIVWQGEWEGWSLRMSRTPFVQRLLSCCTAVPGILVYFVDIDVVPFDEQLWTRQFQSSTHLTISHHRGPSTECATTMLRKPHCQRKGMLIMNTNEVNFTLYFTCYMHSSKLHQLIW